MRGDYGKREFFDDCISFVSTGVRGREGVSYAWGEGDLCCDRSKDGGKLRSLYIVNLVSRALRGGARERAVE